MAQFFIAINGLKKNSEAIELEYFLPPMFSAREKDATGSTTPVKGSDKEDQIC